MKKILIIAFAVFGYFTKAQQQELLENTWYLEKLEIEGIEYFTPENNHIDAVSATFYGETLITYVCNELSGGIEFDDINNAFSNTSDGWSVTMIDCTPLENQIFENHYFYEFWSNNFTEIPDPFHYEINSNGEALSLVVTNSEGSKAYYNNAEMSVSDVTELNKGEFQVVFQNENLIIKNRGSRAESVSIYDLNGKMLLSNSVSSKGIVSTSQLPKGIYIIRLTDEKGNIFSKKLRKN